MDSNITVDNLQTMKYAELQKCAKSFGIKANMKADKLLKDLTEYLQTQHKDTGFARTSVTLNRSGDGDTSAITESSDNEVVVNIPKKANNKGRKRKAQTKSEESSDNEVVFNIPKKAKNKGRKRKAQTKSEEVKTTPAKSVTSSTGTEKSKVSANTPRTPLQLSQARRTATPKFLSARRLSKPITPNIVKRSGTPVTASKSRPLTPAVKTPISKPSPASTPSNQPAGKRKRSSTRTPVSLKDSKKSVKEPSAKKQKQDDGSGDSGRQTRRRSTFEKPSPSLLDSMKVTMTNEEQLKSLTDTLERRAHEKGVAAGYGSDGSSGSDTATHIPRFTGRSTKTKKVVTPGNKDWEKVHQKQFDRMESIDDYLNNKKKRAGDLKLKKLKKGMQSALDSLKKHKTPPSLKKSATAATIEKAAKTRTTLFKSPGVPFVPKITSTRKMNLNFCDTSKTPSFSGKARVSTSYKTPANQSMAGHTVHKNVPSNTKENVRKSVGANRKSTATTPFKFPAGMNTSLNQSTKKKKVPTATLR